MTLYFEGRVQFVPDPTAWTQFTVSPSGVVGSDLRRRGRKLVLMAKSTVGKRTGELAASINMQYFAVKNPYIRVGSEVDHAYIVHEGTRPHIIKPNDRQVMRFKVRGRIVYAEQVEHPGTKGSKYLSRHLRKVVND